jgi:hypothetical protein
MYIGIKCGGINKSEPETTIINGRNLKAIMVGCSIVEGYRIIRKKIQTCFYLNTFWKQMQSQQIQFRKSTKYEIYFTFFLMPKHFCLRAKPPSSDIFLLRGQVLNSITECILVKQLVNKVPLVILQKWIYYWTRVPTERMGKYISNFNSLTLLQLPIQSIHSIRQFSIFWPINDVISVAVFDIRGRLVFNRKKKPETILTIELEQLPAENYLVRLSAKNYTFYKILKQQWKTITINDNCCVQLESVHSQEIYFYTGKIIPIMI